MKISTNLNKIIKNNIRKRWYTLNNSYADKSDYLQDSYVIFLQKNHKIDQTKTLKEQYKYILRIINNNLSKRSLRYKNVNKKREEPNFIDNKIMYVLPTKTQLNIEEYINREKLTEDENNLLNKYLAGYDMKEIAEICNEPYTLIVKKVNQLIIKLKKQNI